MKVIIRTDSSLLIGTGHVIRCLTLAHYLRAGGISVSFVCRNLEGNIISLIEEKQFKVIRLSSPKDEPQEDQYDKMRGVPLDFEISEMWNICQSEKPNWIIVDHYGLNKVWEESIKNQGMKIFVIDDLLRNHTCDALLDQNYHISKFPYQSLVPTTCSCFTGPEFTLLNPVFTETIPRVRNFNNISKILVFFGGTDPERMTLKFLKAAEKVHLFQFHIVVGIKNPDLPEIEAICAEKPNLTLHIQITNMAQLMNECDLYLGSGGTVTWERCFLGLPGICVSVADNQIEISKALGILMAHYYLGESKNLKAEDYINALLELVKKPELLEQYNHESQKLNVGKNVDKIIDIFLNHSS